MIKQSNIKVFLSFVRKEALHILRDKRTLVVLFGLPVIQIILFGFAIRTEINKAHIGVLDLAKDWQSEKFINKLISSGYYILEENFHNYHDVGQSFKSGEIDQAIIIPTNFSVDLKKKGKSDIQILNDASNPNLAGLINSYTKAITFDFQKELNAENVSIPVDSNFLMLYNKEMKSVYMFVPGLIAVILLLVTALMTSITITREKELGTMEVILVSPLRPGLIITGKVMPYVLLAVLDLSVIMIISFLTFSIPFRGDIVLFLMESLLFLLTALSLGIFISTIAKTQQTAMMISLAGLMMPSIILSGFIFPIKNMPYVLQLFSHIIPAKWFLIIIKGILLKGSGLQSLWQETLILLFMTLFFIAMSIKKFKIRL